MGNPWALPGLVQLLLAVIVMAMFGLILWALGVPDGWAGFGGIFLGSLLLGLWESSATRK